MKQSLTLLLLSTLVFHTNGQITLEHTYPNTGYFSPSYLIGTDYGTRALYLVHLEIDGDKYVDINRKDQKLNFYNLDHTFFKSLDYSTVDTTIGTSPAWDKAFCDILYISQSLFDTDAEIEFLYCLARMDPTFTWHAITQMVNEDGAILFSHPGAPVVKVNVHTQYYPIYNTSNGTKMIISNINGTADVFSLTGTFSTDIAENNFVGKGTSLDLFPNPVSQGTIIIEYKLPQENEMALLLISDEYGNQIKSYVIESGKSNLQIDISNFSQGVYHYTILSMDGTLIGNKKSIVIR